MDEGEEAVNDVAIIVDAGTTVGGGDEEGGGLLADVGVGTRWMTEEDVDVQNSQTLERILLKERYFEDEPKEGLA